MNDDYVNGHMDGYNEALRKTGQHIPWLFPVIYTAIILAAGIAVGVSL